MLTDTPQWVALYTKSRAEKKAEEKLRERGFETYLPLRCKLHRWSDRWKTIEEPLLPGYLFARIRRTDVIPVRSIDFVVNVVSWHYQPAVIPDSEMAALRRLVDSDKDIFIRNNEGLQKGAMVRITGGEFNGMTGVLFSEETGGNFGISITGLDFFLVVEVERNLLEVISPTAEKANE